MSTPQWIIVGAGFTGAVLAERIASQLGQSVLVIDRRDHIGGNAYDYKGPYGILVHKYGPHIFHTNSKKIWDYLSRFTEWRPYFHHVVGHVDGCYTPIPFNLNTLADLFPRQMADQLSQVLIDTYGYGKKVPILKMREEASEQLRFLADYVYQKVFENYTIKQWSLRPEQLDPSVSARVPIHISRDNRYFQDIYQAMPADGYSAMFERILAHENIAVETSTDFDSVRGLYPDAKVVFTGPIDEYFDFAHGALPYRSIRFRMFERDEAHVLPVGTVNYPNEFDFTRITEFKHLTGQSAPGSVLIEEYPEAYVPGRNEPYYPIPTDDTASALRPYQQMAQELRGKVWFAGRLGDYAYYNMDQACGRALALFEKQLSQARPPETAQNEAGERKNMAVSL
ncbi:UDP-galactopyranose mutase [Bosea lathyri]|uniref:UDP-galactopyranose mutase n=1 Tax=Bosea lathyri TaxID=1036778 RepID=A0A1H5YT60_9HYPH|nr:UDP-galactopyranose mutase [Bosea lathyri]SEG26685.1 UDP-galactopyranose mutase [Bosea lathyri]